MWPAAWRVQAWGLAALFAVPLAAAHTLGSGADGPVARFALPAWSLWLAGAGVVAVSFLMVAAFLTRPSGAARRAHASEGAARVESGSKLRVAARVFALGLLLVALTPAVWRGAADSLTPAVIVWLVLWTVLPFAAYVAFDAWRFANPFALVGAALERIRGSRRPFAYPTRLGAWPATLAMLVFIGLEVSRGRASGGRGLATILLAYSALTTLGMMAFGTRAWLDHGELFTRLMRTLHAAAPLTREGGRWRARWPWQGLRSLPTRGAGEVAFIVAVLYGVNFDGFLGTRVGASILAAADARLGATGGFVAVLLAGYAVFLGAFWLMAAAAKAKSESLEPTHALAARFAASLVPIAVAYHAAHNLPYLMENAPSAWTAVRDPFGLSIASVAPIRLSAAWLDAISLAQLALIVGGHVVAVATAHTLAVDGFPSRIQAFRSEVPLTYVMVFYTLVGLWIVGAAASGVSL